MLSFMAKYSLGNSFASNGVAQGKAQPDGHSGLRYSLPLPAQSRRDYCQFVGTRRPRDCLLDSQNGPGSLWRQAQVLGALSRSFGLSFVLSALVLRESWGLHSQGPSGPRGLSDLVCLVPLLSICTVGFLQLQRASHPYSLINSLLLWVKPEAVRMSLARIPGAYYLEEVAHSQTLSTRALNPFSAVSASTGKCDVGGHHAPAICLATPGTSGL